MITRSQQCTALCVHTLGPVHTLARGHPRLSVSEGQLHTVNGGTMVHRGTDPLHPGAPSPIMSVLNTPQGYLTTPAHTHLLLHRPVLHDGLHPLLDNRPVLNLCEGLLTAHLTTNALAVSMVGVVVLLAPNDALLLSHNHRNLL